ncbi:ion transporter [Diaminobutyricibacter sp. McL0608]|uniref:ion transporter n=1 Tax=Leifsonia sp. McL0608 TaxID=3143537 RepID=UPI0031F2DFA2
MAKKQRSELKSTGYEIFIGILSILSIVNIFLLYLLRDPALDQVIEVMNAIFSAVFLIDFTYRIVTAPSRSAYFFRHFGWADLLASLPFPQFKILRIFRLVRVYRLLRKVGIRTVGRTLIRDRAGSALYVLLLMGVFVLQFGSLWILRVEEHAPGANITTASDALWYTIVTISTVGYGDQYPVTQLGRIIGTVIIIVGVGIFGTFTGYLATVFLGSPKTESGEAGEAPAAEVPTAEVPAAAATDTAAADIAATDTTARDATIERMRILLAQSEANLAELRQLVDSGLGR